ncbi:hypothetical protein Tgr7_0419 [Thioalkalivibrio sulfidiphilus HL-EbGr7]|uniref:Uncharacterized protein n=1 Tax=Thioalkalivibrio sulfidiphilus (strain HL-EbGR7) TaxID=396588 RepID=B8GKZ9_THISH|nr:hypothetical protein [Thioalkalivibrio sulfidiphilus]ACL71517.1 hypothetical protein Tgr7_0419 [Thioalkalivibrio sulfidiphilus HL-EbGr7]
MKYLVYVGRATSMQGDEVGYAWRVERDGSVVISGWSAGSRARAKQAAQLVRRRLERSDARAPRQKGWHLPEHSVHLAGSEA